MQLFLQRSRDLPRTRDHPVRTSHLREAGRDLGHDQSALDLLRRHLLDLVEVEDAHLGLLFQQSLRFDIRR